MTDREIIREQINIELSNLHVAQEQGIITRFNEGKLEALEGIADFIDSMKEDPVSKELEEAAVEWFNSVKYKSDLSGTPINAFKAGTKWKELQMMSKAIDGEIGYWNLYGLSVNVELPLSVEEGDKVKVIVIEKE